MTLPRFPPNFIGLKETSFMGNVHKHEESWKFIHIKTWGIFLKNVLLYKLSFIIKLNIFKSIEILSKYSWPNIKWQREIQLKKDVKLKSIKKKENSLYKIIQIGLAAEIIRYQNAFALLNALCHFKVLVLF